MKKLLLLTISLILFGCASYSPEQLQAKAEDKSDFDLCYDLILSDTAEYSINELAKRDVDCNTHKDEITKRYNKRIKTGQMLYALGGALRGDMSPMPSSTPDFNLPDFSSDKPTVTGFFSHEVKSGMGKICYYNALGTIKAINKSAVDLCPLSAEFTL